MIVVNMGRTSCHGIYEHDDIFRGYATHEIHFFHFTRRNKYHIHSK